MNDIAARLGISRSTVSKELNHASDISEEMRKKILETAVELGYRCISIRHSQRRLPMKCRPAAECCAVSRRY